MCLGIPMRIEIAGEGWADCLDRDGTPRRVNTLLLEAHGVGDWVLVHLDNAIRVLHEDEARQIGDALQAVNAVLHGENVDHLFADLIGREPELPEALRSQQGVAQQAPTQPETKEKSA